MKNFKRSLLCAFLVVLMAVGGISVPFMFTASAATEPSEGMSFTADELYVMSKALETEILTFEMEIYLPDRGNSRSGTVVGNYYDQGGTGNRLGVEIREGGFPQLYTASTQNNLRSKVSIYDYCKNGDYVHIAIVAERIADAKDKTYFYYNGVLVDTVEYEIPAGVLGSTKTHVVGGDNRGKDGKNNQYFKGKIKNIALFTDVRTPEEIAADAAVADSEVVSGKDNLAVCYDLTATKMGIDMSGNNVYLILNTEKGLTFTKGVEPTKLTKNPSKISTIEATVFLAPDKTGRAGVIVGNVDMVNKKQFSFEIYGGGVVRLYYNDTTGSLKNKTFSAATSILTGTWVNIAVVHTGTELQCYINGELVETITNDIGPAIGTPGLSLCLGGDNRDGNTMTFNGAIRTVTMYSDIRTAEEVKSDYESGVVLTDAGLIAHYDMTDATADDYIKDLSGHGYDFSRTWMNKSGIDLTPYSYSFAVLGDTQKLNYYDTVTNGVTGEGSKMGAIYDWIVANKDAKNIQYVMGLGDVTDKDLDDEWTHALNQFAKLEAAGIPYTVVRGNHESVAQYNKYMTSASLGYTGMIEGCYKKGDYTNSYTKFSVGDIKYMVFTLNYGAEDAVLNWAGDLIKANPDHRVIITTHCYLYRDGTTLDKGDVCPPDSTGNKTANNGDEMWDKLISKHPNIFLVLSGHDPCTNVIMTQTKGDYGNTVTQFLIDPQGMDAKYNYDTGMIALLHFTADGKDVAVEYVSGVTGKYFCVENQFEFELVDDTNKGILRIELAYSVGNVDTYHIYYTNGTYSSYNVTNGVSVTITDIKKTSDGLTDTYTIYFSDGTSTTYTVTNGTDGEDGKDGVDGKVPYIGENGNWWIGNTDTGVRADGGAPAEPDYGNEIIGGTCGGNVNWVVTDKNILVISGNGSMSKYNVGKTPWADYAEDITDIVIKNGVTSISKNAFFGFSKLESVKLPETLLSIERYAFYGCTELDSIFIPAGVRSIGGYAFRNTGLSSLVLATPEAWSIKGLEKTPDKMDYVGVAAAYIKNTYAGYEWYVSDVAVGEVIANGVCGADLFWNLTSDGTLTIYGTGAMDSYRATTMPWYDYIGSIFNVVIEDGVTTIGNYAFAVADKLMNVTIPDGITSIGSYAFYATAIEDIDIPATVKVIGRQAFAKCALKNVYFVNADGWSVNGTAILSSQLLDPSSAAECVALNASIEWKLEDGEVTEE